MGTVGDVFETEGKVTIAWKIKDFSLLPDESDAFYVSPEFYFSGASWKLRIYPNGEVLDKSEGWIGLYIFMNTFGSDITVDVTFSLKTVHEKEHSAKSFCYTFKTIKTGFGHPKLISRSTLLDKKSELLPSGTLTVICGLKNNESKDAKGSLFDRLKDVRDNLTDVYKREKRTDLLLKFDEGNIHAHRMILETRSPVFAAMFSYDTKENKTGEISIDADKSSMEAILLNMYSGDVEEPTTENVLSIYAAAEKYDVKDMKKMCRKFILHNLSVEWICDVIKFAELYQIEEIGNRAREFFKQNAKKVLDSDRWERFVKENHLLAVELLSTVVRSVLPD